MELLGIQSILVGNGKSTINGLSIAGKGCVGLVFKARSAYGLVALKVMRTDAERESMEREAFLHRLANKVSVGPRYMGHTEELLAMEFIEGQSIGNWAKSACSSDFRRVARSILDQCYQLDRAGLDHGELARPGRHVIISPDGNPSIIDFESASTARRAANVTSAAQSLFLYGTIAAGAKKLAGVVDTQTAIAALRRYKQTMSDANYYDVVRSLGIDF